MDEDLVGCAESCMRRYASVRSREVRGEVQRVGERGGVELLLLVPELLLPAFAGGKHAA